MKQAMPIDSILKPCPFCGSKAEFADETWTGHSEGGTLWGVRCVNRDCGAKLISRSDGYPYHQDKESGCAGAAEHWNRRA